MSILAVIEFLFESKEFGFVEKVTQDKKHALYAFINLLQQLLGEMELRWKLEIGRELLKSPPVSKVFKEISSMSFDGERHKNSLFLLN